jgi:hypothetical protein
LTGVEDVEDRSSIPAIASPPLWTKLEPAARVGLVSRALASSEGLEKLIYDKKLHAVFLVEAMMEWLGSGSPKDLACARSLVAAVNRLPKSTGLRPLFWEEADRHLPLHQHLHKELEADADGSLSEIVLSLVGHVTQPLLDAEVSLSATIRRPWAFSPGTDKTLKELSEKMRSASKGKTGSDERGEFLAESFLQLARYPLSLDARRLNSIMLDALQGELDASSEILLSVGLEAAADDPDWPLLRSFWLKLDGDLEKSGKRGSLKMLVDILSVHRSQSRALRP